MLQYNIMSYLICLFCKTYSCFSAVLCSSAISFKLEALLPPFLEEIIPSLLILCPFQILAESFPCPLLASFLLTEYVFGLLIKISSLWTKSFVEPGLFPLYSSLTLHESRSLCLCAGSVLVLSFCLASTTLLLSLSSGASHKLWSGCLPLPFFIQVWYILVQKVPKFGTFCTKTVYVVWYGVTVFWTYYAFGWSWTSE